MGVTGKISGKVRIQRTHTCGWWVSGWVGWVGGVGEWVGLVSGWVGGVGYIRYVVLLSSFVIYNLFFVKRKFFCCFLIKREGTVLPFYQWLVHLVIPHTCSYICTHIHTFYESLLPISILSVCLCVCIASPPGIPTHLNRASCWRLQYLILQCCGHGPGISLCH